MWKTLLVSGLLYYCQVYRQEERGVRKKVGKPYSQISEAFLTQAPLCLIGIRQQFLQWCQNYSECSFIASLFATLSLFAGLCMWK